MYLSVMTAFLSYRSYHVLILLVN